MTFYWVLGLLFLYYAEIAAYSKPASHVDLQEFRLPQSIVPTGYVLRLQPILDETSGFTRFTAPGSVNITVNCTEDTTAIKLHALDLTIIENSTVVKDVSTGQPLTISAITTQPEYHFLIINLVETLNAGAQYEIYIRFVTPVSQTRLDGMYLDSYIDPATDETKYVATTLFAAISARRCFPSFDEPQMKAVFSVELVRKDGYHSLANRHQIATEPLEGMSGWYVDKFAPSMPMSTYLVAMIVSDMTFEEAVFPNRAKNDNTTIRIYAPYYLINRGGGIYAANQTNTVLSSFEEYFDSTFPFTKLYSVSLPQFYFSAMENWQLITYNDRVLLYFPGETTEQKRYRITSIIAHEVVHHYFGNLVTCEWWTWIWLNEGSATYFSHLGVEMTYPEFNPWFFCKHIQFQKERFITDVFQVAMDFDTTPETHPVANEPTSIQDIGGIYDDIAYEKGASLLRMMHSFLTEEVMQTAIRRYLKEKQYSNARQDELFQIVQETAEELGKTQPASIKDIMDTWTLLSGYPLLRVSRINATNIEITQEYFLWMSNTENHTVFSIPDTEAFVLNPRSEGYYRTLYSKELLQSILQSSINECNTNQAVALNSVAKAKLIDDYMAFQKAGLSKIGFGTVSSEYLCLERENLIVWDTLLKHYTRELLEVYKMQKDTNAAIKIKSSMTQDLLPTINEALDEIESRSSHKGEKTMLHAELVFWSCFIDVTQSRCASYVEEKMNEWMIATNTDTSFGVSSFSVDLEETYLCVAASLNDVYWMYIYKYMESRHSPAAKSRIANALMCTTNVTLLKRIVPQLEEDLKRFFENGKGLQLPIKPENLPYFHTLLRLLFNEPARKLVHLNSYNG